MKCQWCVIREEHEVEEARVSCFYLVFLQILVIVNSKKNETFSVITLLMKLFFFLLPKTIGSQ
jgi:hypothetical protein